MQTKDQLYGFTKHKIMHKVTNIWLNYTHKNMKTYYSEILT